MVQGYPQENSGSACGRQALPDSPGTHKSARGSKVPDGETFRPYPFGASHDQWPAHISEEPKLSGAAATGGEIGGSMLSVTGINHFYYLRDFTDMRCKHSRVLSVIREQLHREPDKGDVFIVMSRDRRIVRLFAYDNRSYSLYEKKFVSGHQFMRVEREGDEKVYRINWQDVVLLLEGPIVKTLKVR